MVDYEPIKCLNLQPILSKDCMFEIFIDFEINTQKPSLTR